VINRTTKIKKLRRGKKLLEWLSKKSESNLYSTTKIKGLTKISFQDIDNIITSMNADLYRLTLEDVWGFLMSKFVIY